MSSKYALLMGDEDGNCVKFLKEEEVDNLVGVLEDYGLDEFVESHENKYPENWPDNKAILIEYKVILPRKVEVVTKLEI